MIRCTPLLKHRVHIHSDCRSDNIIFQITALDPVMALRLNLVQILRPARARAPPQLSTSSCCLMEGEMIIEACVTHQGSAPSESGDTSLDAPCIPSGWTGGSSLLVYSGSSGSSIYHSCSGTVGTVET